MKKASLFEHSSKETLINIIEIMFEVFDLQRLSLESFDLDDYLNKAVNLVGKRFGMEKIILRRVDENEPDKLRVLATFGLKKDKVLGITKVTKGSRLVQRLIRDKLYIYIPDLGQTGADFDQTDLVEEEKLGALLSCPIIKNTEFIGFINYFKPKGQIFNEDERVFLSEHLDEVIQKLFVFADQVNVLQTYFLKTTSDYTATLSDVLISYHDAKNSLILGSEMIQKAGEHTERQKFADDHIKKKIIRYLESKCQMLCMGMSYAA